MADFEKSINTILKQEGGYSNNPNDPGGATNYGISLKFLQNLSDGDIDNNGQINLEDIKKLSQQDAENIYKKYYWGKFNYSAISDQAIATKIFSLAVNMPVENAHKCLQRAVRAVTGEVLKDDGIFGNLSLQSVNECEPKSLLAALKSEAAGYYRRINYPGADKFLKGWLNRAYA